MRGQSSPRSRVQRESALAATVSVDRFPVAAGVFAAVLFAAVLFAAGGSLALQHVEAITSVIIPQPPSRVYGRTRNGLPKAGPRGHRKYR